MKKIIQTLICSLLIGASLLPSYAANTKQQLLEKSASSQKIITKIDNFASVIVAKEKQNPGYTKKLLEKIAVIQTKFASKSDVKSQYLYLILEYLEERLEKTLTKTYSKRIGNIIADKYTDKGNSRVNKLKALKYKRHTIKK